MAEQESEAKQPRRIRKAETLREQVEKRSTDEEQAQKASPVRKVLRPVGRAIATPFRWLGRFKVLRFVGYIFVPPYFRNSWRELRQVTWPTKKESRRLTLAVMIFALLFGITIAVVDYGLDKLFKRILLKS